MDEIKTPVNRCIAKSHSVMEVFFQKPNTSTTYLTGNYQVLSSGNQKMIGQSEATASDLQSGQTVSVVAGSAQSSSTTAARQIVNDKRLVWSQSEMTQKEN